MYFDTILKEIKKDGNILLPASARSRHIRFEVFNITLYDHLYWKNAMVDEFPLMEQFGV